MYRITSICQTKVHNLSPTVTINSSLVELPSHMSNNDESDEKSIN